MFDIFKSTKTHFLPFQKLGKNPFCTKSMFKTTKNAIFGLEKRHDFWTEIILFSVFQVIVHYTFFHVSGHSASAATQNAPPLPLPLAPQSSSSSSPLSLQRKAVTSSCSPRSSPTSSGGVGQQTKQRTYPCNECGKIFNAHYNLTRHMPVHTGKKILIKFTYTQFKIFS